MTDQRIQKILPGAYTVLGAALLGLLAARGRSDSNGLLILSAVVTFTVCALNAWHVLGGRSAIVFIALAAGIGWFAEEMGATRGWFFGGYDYTDVLGARLGAVPIVIPAMWFSLSYLGYVLANFILHHAPVAGLRQPIERVIGSLLAALIVTGYDLGADPYMVYVAKAWIMRKTDGGYFGETVVGFVGWVTVAFAIVFTFRTLHARVNGLATSRFSARHALVPILVYTSFMVFLVFRGHPIETRSIVVFTMGIPAVAGFGTWWHWSRKVAAEQGRRG